VNHTITVSEEQWRTLREQSNEVLAEWWCLLNRWQWPVELPEPEPAHPYPRGGKRSQIMDWIHDKVGDWLVSRTWNKDMPDDVFESFRRKEREPDSAYGKWSAQRIAEWDATRKAKEDAVLASEFLLEDVLDADLIE
jgi:hypothetical protein